MIASRPFAALVAAVGTVAVGVAVAGAAPPPDLVPRVEAAVIDVARQQRHEPPQVDVRLERAAAEIARVVPAAGPPPNEQVQAALWLHGVVEPPPHLVIFSLGVGGQLGPALDELRSQLPATLGRGVFRRVGAAALPQSDATLLVIALQESYIDLDPVPRALAVGDVAPLRGRLRPPFERPEGFLTAPDGQVARLAVGGSTARFDALFRCDRGRGRYQVEITGEDRFGTQVLANFPVYCGVPAPSGLEPAAARSEPPVRDAAQAEARLYQLVNADRAHAGLPSLAPNAQLAAVARAHAADMRDHGFVGHISPTTGSAADRVRRANIDAPLLLENVARAYSPGEAERGLMESPGHRANLLHREATEIGIGVALGEAAGAERELFVTQLFRRALDVVDARSAGELHRKIDGLRRARGLRALDGDAALDAVADDTARALAQGALAADRAGEPASRALGKLADRYRALRTAVSVASGLDTVLSSLAAPVTDGAMNAAGVGVAAGRRPDGSGALFVVVVLAARR